MPMSMELLLSDMCEWQDEEYYLQAYTEWDIQKVFHIQRYITWRCFCTSTEPLDALWQNQQPKLDQDAGTSSQLPRLLKKITLAFIFGPLEIGHVNFEQFFLKFVNHQRMGKVDF